MSEFSITFDPVLPIWALIAFALAGGAAICFGFYRRIRAAAMRAVCFAGLLLCVLNPSILLEQFEPLKTIIALVTDTSDSQKLDGRAAQSRKARDAIESKLAKFPQFDIRHANTDIVKSDRASPLYDASTAVFSSLKRVLRDVPPERVGGAIIITDGEVHDIPPSLEDLGFKAPIHALISGSEEDKDRRLTIHKAPRFGIVGEEQSISYSVEDANIEGASASAAVSILIDGNLVRTQTVPVGEKVDFRFKVPHGGKTLVEFKVPALSGEITAVNNSAFVTFEGIRENLRVLLISGAPHAGERAWRNLLKSDASVDLVHFTILRPAEKEDGTPVKELSLIAFPIRELFIEKIDEFDLIIFDRYKRYQILPLLYFDRIAEYVLQGGAILVAAGNEHAEPSSIHTSPLSRVFPVDLTGEILERPFLPQVSDAGRRHPVTRDLAAPSESWSRWFRHIGNVRAKGDVIMTGANDHPLLVLDRPGLGRIAMLMSDHVWLWARGFDGGGPYVSLLRRVAHWLMKEPALDEEALRAGSSGRLLSVERQTMRDAAPSATIVDPLGGSHSLPLSRHKDGVWRGSFEAQLPGLYRVENGDLRALTHIGPENPREYAHIVSTSKKLRPFIEASGGSVMRLDRSGANIPRIVPLRRSRGSADGAGAGAALKAYGEDWLGLRDRRAHRLTGLKQVSLFSHILGLTLLLSFFAFAWWREGAQ